MTTLEIAASVTTSISILLAGRNSVHTWWTGIIGCVLFGMLFYQAKLYADVVLQLFFIGTSIFGWWQWLYGEGGQEKSIRRAGFKRVAVLAPTGVVVATAYGILLHTFTDAYGPFLDSGILVFSVIGQCLLMQRQLECWLFWLLVNTIAVPLYASRELYLTAFLYSAYWINAILAYYYWRNQITSTEKITSAVANAT
ncbi:nicotinamide riboside transporter PnuC [Microbulbifer harenosus]|uniref:Nicotinamide riboside transporter PnuC n=1 Tax=Microbulbifer harenosus TaxID=2576840 RepID=A0ABY2UJM4_9GAMM|nr:MULTISPECIES: nicotinamide riboside transporter PnuC [Microbulbifer]QIL89538.1 nicotinamide riboside transporter PnuC [Microbulbifer sp. SH-1]TLM78392.1 nicotinamide mononucleotide transporter [Microbulbifer harenosus]